MGFLDFFVGKSVSDVANGIGDGAKKIRQAITGEKSEETLLKEQEIQSNIDIAQAKVNEAEAVASANKSYKTWREKTGDATFSGFCLYLFYPLYTWPIDLYNAIRHGSDIPKPELLDANIIVPLLIGMLGLTGGFKTYEKIKGLKK